MTQHDSGDPKRLSQAKFGENAARYVTSEPHAKGSSLARMVTLANPKPSWYGLDIATAVGHTAFAFAPHVATMVASDITAEMISIARNRAVDLGHRNVVVTRADAESLPFVSESFDLVTCRIAPHHFPDPAAFVAEASRVLRPDGIFVLVDNVAPPDPDSAQWYDDWERARDPSHVGCLTVAEWRGLIQTAGLKIVAAETSSKRMEFRSWADNMDVPEPARTNLLDDLLSAPGGVRSFLEPTGRTQQDATFQLTEALFAALRTG